MSGSPPQAELNVLDGLFDGGRLDEVIERGEKLLAQYPDSFFLHQMLGTANGMLGHNEEAAACLGRALRIKPDFAIGHLNLGVALEQLGRGEEAVASYEEALRLMPDCAEAYYCLGATLHALGRLDEAVAAYEEVLRFRPDHAEAHYNLATVLRDLERIDDDGQRHVSRAIACYRRALEINPNFAEAHLNLGVWLQHLGGTDDAIAHYRRALEIKPDFAEAHLTLGVLLQRLRRFDEAIACQRRALQIRPDYAEAYRNLGLIAQDLGRPLDAIACYERALQLKPDYADARSQKLYQQAQICDWDALRSDAHLMSTLGISGDPAAPFVMLYLDDDPERNRSRSELLAATEYRRPSPPLSIRPTASPDRIRIGYFSADFHEHAVMHFIARLIELHDRSRFSVHLFSYGADSADQMRQRLKGAADAFHEVRALGDSEVADLARRQQIDIAVDLMGYTYANRLGIFSYRAAPIQISYLGFPGTLGTQFIDYIVADRVVVPEEQRQHISEHILYLPNSYQVNDDRRPISDRAMTRAEMNLPQDAFVFCCFNNTCKISPELFDVWMRLLDQVEGSVLWLFKANSWAESNLRQEAQKRGIEADRLIFANQMPLPEHLARHRLADLSLDTFDYNGHATASHALWAGLPLVTRIGQGFAARVASSLLTAIGLPELIAATSQDYERIALAMARDPNSRSEIRARLASNRLTAPLFDAKLSARHMEAAYEQAYQAWFDGRPPADIFIEQVAC